MSGNSGEEAITDGYKILPGRVGRRGDQSKIHHNFCYFFNTRRQLNGYEVRVRSAHGVGEHRRRECWVEKSHGLKRNNQLNKNRNNSRKFLGNVQKKATPGGH